MDTMKRALDKDLGMPAVIGAFLVAVAIGVELVPELTATPVAPGGAIFAGALPARPLALRPEAAASRPLAARPARAASDGPMSLDEFLGALESSVPAPVASTFAKAFIQEPVLRKAMDDFRREKGGKAPAVEFLQRVARLAEFRQVVSQFRSEPGFQRAFLQLAKTPGIDGVIRGVKAALKPSGVLAAAGPIERSGTLRRLSSLSSSRGLASTLAGGASFRATRGAGLVAAASGAGPGSGAAASATGGNAGAEGSRGPGGYNAAGAEPGQLGGEALTKLAAPTSVDQTRDASRYLASIFASAPKHLREALEHQCFDNDICDPIAACQAAGLYDECKAFCDATPSCSGIIPPESTLASSTGETAGPGTGPAAGGSQTPTILRDDQGNPTVTVIMPPNPDSCPVPTDSNENWTQGGELVGGAVGTVGGAMIGAAIGGPVGGLIGGAVGGVVGTVVGGFIGGALGGIFG